MKCDFQVGDKVVCINADKHYGKRFATISPQRFRDDDLPLVEGAVYTISEIRIDNCSTNATVYLKEIPLRDPVLDHGYDFTRFRKVQPKKTDISIFTDMLKTKELEQV